MTNMLHFLQSSVLALCEAPLAREAAWLALSAAVKSVPLLAAAAGLSVCLRRAPAAARHMVWLMAIVCLLSLPLVSFWQQRLPRHMLRPLTVSSPFADPVALRPALSPEQPPSPAGYSNPQGPFKQGSYKPVAQTWRIVVVPPPGQSAPAPLPQPAPQVPARSTRLSPLALAVGLFIGWLVVAVALILRLALSLLVAGRIARSCVDISEGPFFALARDAARRLGGAPRFTVRLGRLETLPAVPMTIGLFAPTVLLPQGAAQWPKDRLEAALLHELAHVRRRDWAGQMLTSFACALYWFNPLVWLAAKRLRVESEMACDDQVLMAGAPATDYAGHLLEMARALSSARPGVPTAVAAVNRPQIEGRLKAILDRARSRRALSPRARALALTLAVGLLIPLGLMRFESRAAARMHARAMPAIAPISKATPRAPAGSLPILTQTKGTSPMLSLKPLVSKAAAALASLTLLASPIPAGAQDSAPPAPPAPPANSAPATPATTLPAPAAKPAPDKGPSSASSDYYVEVPATPDKDGKIVTADGKVIIVNPATPSQAVPTAPPSPVQPQFGVGEPGTGYLSPPGPVNSYPLLYDYIAQQDSLPADAVRRNGQNSYDISVTQRPVEAVLAKLCQTAGVNSTIGTNIAGQVTVYLHNVSFEDALRSILRASDTPLTYSMENGVYHIEKRQVPQENEDAQLPHGNVTLDLDNAPFDKALKDLCDNARASYTIVSNNDKSLAFNAVTPNNITAVAPWAQTAVTVHLHDVPFPAALRALLNATSPSLTYSVKDGIIYIRPGAQAEYYGVVVPQSSDQSTYELQLLDRDQAASDRLIEQGALPRNQHGTSPNLGDVPMLQGLTRAGNQDQSPAVKR